MLPLQQTLFHRLCVRIPHKCHYPSDNEIVPAYNDAQEAHLSALKSIKCRKNFQSWWFSDSRRKFGKDSSNEVLAIKHVFNDSKIFTFNMYDLRTWSLKIGINPPKYRSVFFLFDELGLSTFIFILARRECQAYNLGLFSVFNEKSVRIKCRYIQVYAFDVHIRTFKDKFRGSLKFTV